jgi:hypothetical protein
MLPPPGSGAADNTDDLSDPLFSAIRDLASVLLTETQGRLAAGTLVSNTIQYGEPQITQLTYDHGNIGYQETTSVRVQERLDPFGLNALATDMAKTPEYKRLAEAVGEVSLEAGRVSNVVHQLLLHLAGSGCPLTRLEL